MKSKFVSRHISKAFCLVSFLGLANCSTLSRSLVTGSAIGAGTGAAIGAAAGGNVKGALIGAGVGTAVGALFGYSAFENSRKTQIAQWRRERGEAQTPDLNPASIRSMWIPESIEGDRLTEGHWIYVIDRPATFRGTK